MAQEVTVGLAETHRVGQRGEHLRRRAAVAALLEPDEVVDADAGEGGELGATKPGRAAAGADRQADVGGRHGFAPRAQERSELSDVHDTKCASVPGRRRVAPVGTRLHPASRQPAKACMVIIMTDTISQTLPLTAGRWPLDTAHFNVAFGVGHLGVSKVRGRFGAVDAELVVGESLADTSVTATVTMASLDTGNNDRDAHVLTPDFLDAESRPHLTFRSTAIQGDGDSWTMDGDLTIGEVTRPVTFDVAFGGVARSTTARSTPASAPRARSTARTSASRSARPTGCSATSSSSSSTSSSSSPTDPRLRRPRLGQTDGRC